ncbi:MAG TPA: hypothetical protein VKR31_01095 [Rhizomicrobium sp.]|nr:hypothetical protein [Rhizomicrobium sp.]
MQMFVILIAALPMVAAALPMFVSIGAAIAGRYSHGQVRSSRPVGKSTTATAGWR